MATNSIHAVEGRGLPLRGHGIDTDRIMPARFLRAVSFEGMERHVFEDDRAADANHPFNRPQYAGATVLIVNSNFGCGSSREHAPQGLVRAGIHAFIGESFSEIFQGNAAILGVPCFLAEPAAIEALQQLVERAPDTVIHADVESGDISAGTMRFTATLPLTLRESFLNGQWNPTAMLLDGFEDVRAVAARLPYLNGF